MSNADDRTEATLRLALAEAADQIEPAGAPLPDPDRPPAPRGSRTRLVLAGIGVVVAALVLGAVALARGGDDGVRVDAGAGGVPTQVTPVELTSSQADLEVFMTVKADDAQVEAIRALVATSPDVREFAFVDKDAAYQEFEQIFCANPDLVDSIRPADLPVSFRVLAVDTDAIARLATQLSGQDGMVSVERGSEAATPAPSGCVGGVTPTTVGQPPPSTTPSTVPEATGPPPDDPDAARNAVVAAFTQAYTGTNSVETRRAAMEDSDALKAQLDQARAANVDAVNTMTTTVSDVTFVDATHAAFRYQLTIAGLPYPETVGYAVFVDGTWKVRRETTCSILELANVQCPAR
jgi:hypothetical protein